MNEGWTECLKDTFCEGQSWKKRTLDFMPNNSLQKKLKLIG